MGEANTLSPRNNAALQRNQLPARQLEVTVWHRKAAIPTQASTVRSQRRPTTRCPCQSKNSQCDARARHTKAASPCARHPAGIDTTSCQRNLISNRQHTKQSKKSRGSVSATTGQPKWKYTHQHTGPQRNGQIHRAHDAPNAAALAERRSAAALAKTLQRQAHQHR